MAQNGTHKGTAKKKITKLQQQKLIERFENTGNITRSCKTERIPRRTFYNWLRDDAEFKLRFAEAFDLALGVLEDEAKRRATEGTLKPVYYQGRKVGSVREYSDTLLVVLLKAHAPEKYKERLHSELTGAGGNPIVTESTTTILYLPKNGREISNAGKGN